MAKWEPTYPILNNPNGDNVHNAVEKTKAEFELIYVLLNALRQNFPMRNEPSDTLPYQVYIDVASKKLYMRNSKDDAWNVLGSVDADYFGLKPEDIGAVANEGTVGSIAAGNAADMPKTAKTNSVYFALDESRLYVYSGVSWKVFASLQFEDISGAETSTLLREEVDYNGKNKVLRLDAITGKGNIDISGSADKIAGYEIAITNLKNGQVLGFDNTKSQWVNRDKDTLTDADVSDNGAANKIVKTDSRGIAHVSITGSSSIVGGVKVDTSNLADKKVLAYNSTNRDFEVADTIAADITGSAQKFNGISIDANNLVNGQFLKYNGVSKSLVSDSNEYLHEGDVSDSGAVGKIVRVDSAGLIHANLAGSASLIGGIAIETAGIKNGQILMYDSAQKKFVPANKDLVSEDMISESGEVGKLIRLGADKTVHANVEGIDGVTFDLDGIADTQLLGYDANKQAVVPVAKDATSIKGITVDITGLKDGQVFIYDAKTKKLVPANKDFVTADDIDSTGAVGKIIRVAANTPLNVDINGSANMIDGVKVTAGNAKDGEVLTYRAATKSFRTEPKTSTGEGKTLTITKGNSTVCAYNGSNEAVLDVSAADKLTTARTIKLTGYAQGQVDFDGSQDVELNVRSVTATLADNADRADMADKLATARKFYFDGDTQGEVEFDGSKNVVVTLSVPKVQSAVNAENADYATQAGAATAAAKAVIADTAASAGTADKLTTARKITFTGAVEGEVTVDWSGDIIINLSAAESSLVTDEISIDELDSMF